MNIAPENIAHKIEHNLTRIKNRMAQAAARAGRPVRQIRLVPVTKTVGIPEMRILYDLGIREFGENRVEKAVEKIHTFGTSVQWHMIGNVQRRKARDVAALFDCVDAIDRVELAETLQRRCEEQNRHLNALIEVNVSGEAAKHGFSPDQLPETLEAIRKMDRLNVQGFLTMAPFDAAPEVIRGVFRALRGLAAAHGLQELSMGMTDDFEIAIEEGATQIRIGRALFE